MSNSAVVRPMLNLVCLTTPLKADRFFKDQEFRFKSI